MVDSKHWDWTTRKKSISMGDWQNRSGWLEEPYASPDGEKIAAIVAPKFGKWTIAVNGQPWPVTFKTMVTDVLFSPDGNRVAALGKDRF